MKVVIFGSGGQLGNELRRATWPSGIELACPPEAEADVTRFQDVERVLSGASLAINAAAYTAVDRAESEPAIALRVNRDGPSNLAKACAAARLPLIHVSTDYVFDGQKAGAYLEDDPVAPLGVYGETKAAGESAVRESLTEHVIVRTSWVFSAFGHNFVKTMLRLAAERDELRVVGDQFGRPTPARDLAAALVAVASRFVRAQPFGWGTYHFAGAGRASWYDLALRTVELQSHYSGRKPAVIAIATSEYPTPARRPPNSELDTSKFEREFAHVPPPWELGLANVVRELSETKPQPS